MRRADPSSRGVLQNVCVTECDQAQSVTLYTYSDYVERVQAEKERYAFYKRKSHFDEMGPKVQYYGLVL